MNSLDEKLKGFAQHTELRIPDGYDADVDRQLEYYRMQPERVQNFSIWKNAAAAVVICVLSVSSAVMAANYLVSERLGQMTDTEIAEYTMGVEQTDANGDSYSRSFTKAELDRLTELNTAYKTQGEYPVSELPTVIARDDIDLNQVCFVIADSYFYFPERELKEEELLQYIDFCMKRNYSMEEVWAENSSEIEVVQSAKTDALSIVQRGLKIIKNSFGVDALTFEYNLEVVTSPMEEGNAIILEFKENEFVSYVVSLYTAEDSYQAFIMDENFEGKGINVDEKELLDNYKLAQEQLRNSYGIVKDEIEDATLIYEKTGNNTLERGTVSYAFKLKDGTGYVIRYECKQWNFVDVNYYTQYSGFEALVEIQIGVREKIGNTLYVIPIDMK